ncbi:MAG: metallophosphoesterase [Deltaproteobacteria bacterium]|nr:metallophosphoesterase [Deltaproteobacteria bacterium]
MRSTGLFVALTTTVATSFAAGCPGPSDVPDAATLDAGTSEDAPMPSDAPPIDAEMHGGLRLPRCEETDPETSALPHFASTLEGTYVPGLDRFPMSGPENPAVEEGEILYRGMGLHEVEAGPGLAHVHREDLGASSTATTGRHSLAWLAHLSDFQLVDDESPSRLATLDNPSIPSGLRSQEAYLPRAVSAMSRTFERILAPDRPLDFAIITGDCADSAQQNELDWVIALMNGEPGLHTDSGDDDDPVPGPDNDPKDPFDPTPFPAPWLYVPGNHDVEVVGINAPSDRNREQALGTSPISGTRDYRLWYAPASRRTITADPRREIIERDQIVATVRAADADGPMGPSGHGYPPTGDVDTSMGANWAYDVVPGVLRVLAIDTSDREGGSEGMILQSFVDGWLIPELDRAVDDGVLVMLASHHSTRSIDVFPGQAGAMPTPGALTGEQIEDIVAARPEVIAWLVGHTHDNQVHAIAGADAAHPGYWEIMTSAIADFPSQARAIELVDNGDGTLSIFATLIDYDTDDCFERRFRALSQMEWISAWTDNITRDPMQLNVELVRAIPDSASEAVSAASMMAPDRIESLTTLIGE